MKLWSKPVFFDSEKKYVTFIYIHPMISWFAALKRECCIKKQKQLYSILVLSI